MNSLKKIEPVYHKNLEWLKAEQMMGKYISPVDQEKIGMPLVEELVKTLKGSSIYELVKNSDPVDIDYAKDTIDIEVSELLTNYKDTHPLALYLYDVNYSFKESLHQCVSTISQLSEATNLSEIAVKSIVDTCIECGIVEGYGNGRGRTYILSAKVYSSKEAKMRYVRQVDIDDSRYLELIVNMARTNEFIARADVVQLLHVDENKAYKLLKKLVDAKQLEPINKGRYAKYKYAK